MASVVDGYLPVCFSTQSTMPYTTTDMTDRWRSDIVPLLWCGRDISSRWQLSYFILIGSDHFKML